MEQAELEQAIAMSLALEKKRAKRTVQQKTTERGGGGVEHQDGNSVGNRHFEVKAKVRYGQGP